MSSDLKYMFNVENSDQKKNVHFSNVGVQK